MSRLIIKLDTSVCATHAHTQVRTTALLARSNAGRQLIGLEKGSISLPQHRKTRQQNPKRGAHSAPTLESSVLLNMKKAPEDFKTSNTADRSARKNTRCLAVHTTSTAGILDNDTLRAETVDSREFQVLSPPVTNKTRPLRYP